jgi:amino acid transporter
VIIKGILQTIGTVITIILGLISFEVLHYTHNSKEISSPMDLLEFALVVMTILISILTGRSYLNSRFEYGGIRYFLYACLGFTHFVLAPAAFIIGGMKIDFGQNWWIVLIGIICLLVWGKSNRAARR